MLSAARARQLFAIHRWTGLLIGIVILFLSLTGTGLVFITEIDRLLNRDLLVSAGTGPFITPERALESVQRAYPKAKVGSLFLPQRANDVYVASVGAQGKGAARFNEIMVDAHSGRILGHRDHTKTFAFILRQMHLRFFFFGWKGRVVVGAFGLTLLLSTLTGLLIYGRFIRALPKWYSIRRDRGFQISTSDWHKLVGIVALAFNIVIAVTGSVLGLENLARFYQPAEEAMHPGAAKNIVPKPPKKAPIVPVSTALTAARAAIPGFEPIQINIANSKHHYMVRGNIEHRIAMEGASEVGVDATTGRPYFVSSARNVRTITKAYYWMDPLHFGYWAGVFSQILYVFFGLTTGFLSVTGFLVWYRKANRRPRAQAMRQAA